MLPGWWLFGLAAGLGGGWLGWRILRVAWLRLLYLGMLAVVTGQAVAGRACFLTVWQSQLSGNAQAPPPLLMHWVDRLIYWNLPIWGFTIMYCLVFLYVAALPVLVPFGRRFRSRGGQPRP